MKIPLRARGKHVLLYFACLRQVHGTGKRQALRHSVCVRGVAWSLCHVIYEEDEAEVSSDILDKASKTHG